MRSQEEPVFRPAHRRLRADDVAEGGHRNLLAFNPEDPPPGPDVFELAGGDATGGGLPQWPRRRDSRTSAAAGTREADQLLDGVSPCASEICEQLAPTAKQRPEQTWRCATGARTSSRNHSAHRAVFSSDSPHHKRAKPCWSNRQRRNSRSTRSFDHRSQRPMLPGKASRPDSEQLLDMALDEAKQRQLAWPPRPEDPAGDLHAQPEAGGRVAGRKRRRSIRLCGPSLWHEHVRPGPGDRLAQAVPTIHRAGAPAI